MNPIEYANQKRLEWREQIHKKMEEVLNDSLPWGPNSHPFLKRCFDAAWDFNFRAGKKTRPSLMIGGFLACNGDKKYWDDILYAGTGIEFSEAWLLMHDDIMDRSPRRRGGDSTHEEMRKYYLQHILSDESEAYHFGISQGINIGDLLAGLVFYAFSKAKIPTIKEAIREWAKVIATTAYGQMLDVYMGSLPLQRIDENLVYTVHYLKAGAYSVEGPVLVGAVLAGADSERKKILADYGRPLGIAFQLWDDVLGLYGDPQKTGKPVDADVKEGKRTLLIVKALEWANDEQRKILLENYGNPDPDLEAVKEVVKETGAYEYNVKKVHELAQKAKDALENNEDKFNEEGHRFLMGFADYLVTREF